MRFFNWLRRAVPEPAPDIPSIVATVPTEPVVYRFQCVESFFSEELRSQYVAGQTYSVRQGNGRLDLFVKQWVQEGKVRRGA